jgi:RNA 2',3'-cyclic 3'-phosphodiesterase
MRLFIGIELPHDVHQHLTRVRDILKTRIARASFTRDENLHITLKFLGEVDSRGADNLIESLEHIRAGGAINVFADKIECFPQRGPVRIIAAGFGGDIAGISSLHRAIEQRCQKLGFDRETREYRPHVTLARARPTLAVQVRRDAEDSCAACYPGPALGIERFALFESKLSSAGAQYTVIKCFTVDPNIY